MTREGKFGAQLEICFQGSTRQITLEKGGKIMRIKNNCDMKRRWNDFCLWSFVQRRFLENHDACMDGRTDGRMDGQTDKQSEITCFIRLSESNLGVWECWRQQQTCLGPWLGCTIIRPRPSPYISIQFQHQSFSTSLSVQSLNDQLADGLSDLMTNLTSFRDA